ncbi:MAG: phospholipase D-like domain-containing protein [Bryocella sp.]
MIVAIRLARAKGFHSLKIVSLAGFALLLTGCHSAPAPGSSQAPQIFYSPATNLEAIDTRLLRSAAHSIDVCAYALTDRAVLHALEQAGARGVRVRIYVDRGQTQGQLTRESKARSSTRRETDAELPDRGESATELATLSSLASAPGVEVRVKHSKTLMHLKSYVVDNNTLRTGSANFSPTGEKRQDNDLVLTTDPAAVAAFTANFAVLWARPDNEPLSPR